VPSAPISTLHIESIHITFCLLYIILNSKKKIVLKKITKKIIFFSFPIHPTSTERHTFITSHASAFFLCGSFFLLAFTMDSPAMRAPPSSPEIPMSAPSPLTLGECHKLACERLGEHSLAAKWVKEAIVGTELTPALGSDTRVPPYEVLTIMQLLHTTKFEGDTTPAEIAARTSPIDPAMCAQTHATYPSVITAAQTHHASVGWAESSSVCRARGERLMGIFTAQPNGKVSYRGIVPVEMLVEHLRLDVAQFCPPNEYQRTFLRSGKPIAHSVGATHDQWMAMVAESAARFGKRSTLFQTHAVISFAL